MGIYIRIHRSKPDRKTMIRINQIKLPIDHKEAAFEKKIKKALHNTEYKQYKIVKRSIDARKKEELSYVYAVDVTLGKGQEEKFLKKNKNRNIMAVKEKKFEFPENQREFKYPPVVIGMGPAGLFAALMLARAGLNPIVLERGKDVTNRMKDVEHFWETGELNSESNVQFGSPCRAASRHWPPSASSRASPSTCRPAWPSSSCAGAIRSTRAPCPCRLVPSSPSSPSSSASGSSSKPTSTRSSSASVAS